MLLACDIGNTHITIGLFRKGKLVFKAKAHTSKAREFQLFLNRLLKTKGISKNQIDGVIFCSVVPWALELVKNGFKRYNVPIYIAGKNLTVPIKNLYAKPSQVGQDRLVNACAGIALYGAPLVVVDFGTAITFDVISRKKEYLGGMILPGLEISLDALSRRTALLPKIKLDTPKGLIGKDTKNSMLSGIIYGFAALADELSVRIKKEIGAGAKVIATGGNIGLIGKYCHNLDVIDSDLTLKGLQLIFQRQPSVA